MVEDSEGSKHCNVEEVMSSASTYVKGLSFELLTIRVLRRHSFIIQHCGKSGDRGIDFRGQWILPDNKLSVIGQCKNQEPKASPSQVRELEAIVNEFSSGSLITGVLVSQSGFVYNYL
ncbi:PREDICTED: uncharacterized protein C824.03c, mitochondrial-like [Amphimedon queenslandica]|uniref:Restriction endonuclease type IV Mrr domain-containing protein n=2 Tax=Amphimedon queenslandica TaxID=400682 RepID=A0AAN0JHH8_AMPQE|nr:PREDICTED: uncharacterized protein C824.03c, mitochondrial-like [Amphimedon queenslandica]|eukprot:XP_019856113.1 PREDICTED: uncharacterized protein C824.03c, mitochondrial-like [Amphimedon queenslandica]